MKDDTKVLLALLAGVAAGAAIGLLPLTKELKPEIS
jgi:hypothetical protein